MLRRDGMALYRRRAHLVVWDASGRVTLAPYDLYWSRDELRTYARVSHVGTESLYLSVLDLIGHWDWYAGEIAGARILDGWGPDGPCMPMYDHVTKWPTGKYWYSGGARWVRPYERPDPMAHT